MTDARPYRPPLASAVVTMFATYALVILASMVLPVLAPIASDTLSIPARYIGLYAGVLYAAAAASSMIAPNIIARYGALRTSQGALVFAGAAFALAQIGGVLHTLRHRRVGAGRPGHRMK